RGGGFRCRCRRRFGAFTLGVDHRNDLLRSDRRPIGLANLSQHAGIGRWKLEHYLVGFDVDQILVALDRLSGFLVPIDERRLGNGLRQNRDFDLNSHPLSSVPLATDQHDSPALVSAPLMRSLVFTQFSVTISPDASSAPNASSTN